MTSLTIRSFAKLNIALDVLEKRPDGYHSIESVIQSISLHDVLTISKSGDGIRVEVSDPAVPSGEGNLVYRACVMFLEAACFSSGVDITIEKNIPMQAGLGGGSSNAAATIRGLNKLFDSPLEARQIQRICAALGSDVPFFLVGGTAFVSGRGEEVSELPDCPLDFLIVKPDFGISTAWAYAQFGEQRDFSHCSRTASEACRCVDREAFAQSLGNDFQQIAESAHPRIAAIRSDLMQAGADGALLAGSGSAVFGAFLNAAACDAAYEDLMGKYERVFRARGVTREEFLA